ncbi:hypothetical protein B0H17DRAFT_1204856 [Mycena rosella]|uniref:Retrotransposon gag domain-containing protein n=1 Tax=Mycena rosella TaxID=1033263 RepID=A0AAD7D8H8_MYCRO|nr:hypothetical protein B0H17DRAFT_1204856 [Mycena rosella]
MYHFSKIGSRISSATKLTKSSALSPRTYTDAQRALDASAHTNTTVFRVWTPSFGAWPSFAIDSTRIRSNPRARTCVPVGSGLHLSKGTTNTVVFCLVFGLAPVHPLIRVLAKARHPGYERISCLAFGRFGLLACSCPEYDATVLITTGAHREGIFTVDNWDKALIAVRRAKDQQNRSLRLQRRTHSVFEEVTLAENDPITSISTPPTAPTQSPLVAITATEELPLTSRSSTPEPTTTDPSHEASQSSIPPSDITGTSDTLPTEYSITDSSTPQTPLTNPLPLPRKRMTKTLPGRGAKGAPEFDGKPLSLVHYWEDVEEVAEFMERTGKMEKITLALRYVLSETEVLWKGIMTPQTTTWMVFKALITELYPGANGSKMFTLRDLDNFVNEQELNRIKTKEDFSEYHRRFKTMTVHLISKSKMTTLEEKRQYPKGIEERFRNRVYHRLQIVSPNHPSDEPYDIADFVTAAKYILDGPSPVDDGMKDTAFIKKEMVDLSNAFQKLNTQFKVEMQLLHRVVAPPAGQYITAAPQFQNRPTYPMYQATALENAPRPQNRFRSMYPPGERSML